MSFIPRPAYRIETERLVLRPWDPSDAPAMAESLAASREHLLPWLAWARDEPTPLPALVDRIRRFRAQFDLGTDFVLGIFDAGTGAVLGGTGLHHRVGPGAAEIGYWVDVRQTRRGIATEAAAALTRVGLGQLPYRKLEIRVVPGNEGSARIPGRLGYRSDGTLRAHLPGQGPRDPWRPVQVFSLLREELSGSEAERRAADVRAYDAQGIGLEAPTTGTPGPIPSQIEDPKAVGEDRSRGDVPPPTEPDARPPGRATTLSPVQRARLEDYLEALEEQADDRRAALRTAHPELGTEFDAVESAFRRLSGRIQERRQAQSEFESMADSVDPGISLDRGPAAPGSGRGTPADADLLRRIAERSAPPERYRARREIARGGMGSIQRVWDEDLRRYLVMKIMLRPQDRNPQAKSVPPDSRQLTRFLEEAQITGQLDHPGILPVHDIGLDEEGRLYFTMPLVKGQDLAEVIGKARGNLDGWNRNRVLNVLVRVMEATAFAHDRGVVHRDLKPENIMVGQFGEAYVMDWGLARVLDELDRQATEQRRSMTANLKRRVKRSAVGRVLQPREGRPSLGTRGSVETLDGDMVGTPGYMAPEQARGERDLIGPRSDIYALGAVIYQLLTGSRPFDDPISRASDRPLLERILEGHPVPIRELSRDQPDELVAICEKAMAEDPADRYASVLDLTEDVRAFLEGHVVHAYEAGPFAEMRKWVLRNRVLASVTGSAALVVLVAAVALIVQQRTSLEDLSQEQERTAQALVEAENQRNAAEEQRSLAETQRDAADFQRNQALDAKRALEEVNTALELGRDLANQKAAEAATAERAARRLAYVGNVTAASIALRTNELNEARRLLEACPPELRRWEWEHLRARLDVSLSSWELPGREPVALAVLDDDRVALLDRERGLSVVDVDDGRSIVSWSLEGATPVDLAHDPNRDHLWISRGAAPLVRLDTEDPDQWFQMGPEFGTDPRRVEWGPIALSPGGNRLAAGVTSAGLAAADLVVSIFDTRTGAVVSELTSPAARSISALDWSPDGLWLALGFEDGSVQLWDAPQERLVHALRPHEDPIVALDFGADSERLAVACDAQDASILDVATGSLLRSIRGHDAPLTDLAFAPFDAFLVTVSADRGLKIWDADTGEQRGQLRGHDGPVLAVGVTPDAERVVSLAADRSLRSWDPRSPDAVTALTLRNSRRGLWLGFSADGRRLVAPSSFDAELLNLTTLDVEGAVDTSGLPLGEVLCRPEDAEMLATRGATLAAFEDGTGSLLRTLFPMPNSPGAIALSGDGRTLVVCTLDPKVRAVLRPDEPPPRPLTNLLAGPTTILGWRLDRLAPDESPDGPWPFGAHFAHALPVGVDDARLQVDETGQRAFVVADDGRLRELSLIDGPEPCPVRIRASTERLLEASITLQLRAQRRFLGAWHGSGGWSDLPPSFGPVTPATVITLAPDGSRLGVGFRDGRIELWPTAGAAAPILLRSNSTTIGDLTFDARAERLVSGAEDGSLRVFDLELGEQVLRLDGHRAAVGAVEFSPSGRDLLSLDASGELRLWSTASLRERFVARRDAERVRRAARNYLIATLEGFVSTSELMSQLDADRTLDSSLRERARTYLRAFGENAARLNGDAWATVQSSERTAEDYRDAYLWSLFAHTLEPDEPLYERTLGIAYFRLGRAQKAIETLERSSRAQRRGPRAEELAVLALSYAAIGDGERSSACRRDFDLQMRSGIWSRDPVARGFDREVRTLLGPPDSASVSGPSGG